MYANIQSDESVEYYKKNQDKMVQGIAQGIYQYFSL
jgi:phage shock protein PspC (stress-responsive transcriptional regulator)